MTKEIDIKPASVDAGSTVRLVVPRNIDEVWVLDTGEDAVQDPHNNVVWYLVQIGGKDTYSYTPNTCHILSNKEVFYVVAKHSVSDKELFVVNENTQIDQAIADLVLILIAKFDGEVSGQ